MSSWWKKCSPASWEGGAHPIYTSQAKQVDFDGSAFEAPQKAIMIIKIVVVKPLSTNWTHIFLGKTNPPTPPKKKKTWQPPPPKKKKKKTDLPKTKSENLGMWKNQKSLLRHGCDHFLHQGPKLQTFPAPKTFFKEIRRSFKKSPHVPTTNGV